MFFSTLGDVKGREFEVIKCVCFTTYVIENSDELDDVIYSEIRRMKIVPDAVIGICVNTYRGSDIYDRSTITGTAIRFTDDK